MNGSGGLIELPKNGKVLIVTDIHGNLDDFNRFMDMWDDFKDKNNYLVITGDIIQSIDLKNDKSIEIMNLLFDGLASDDNFHLLLGNHEWSVISKIKLFKSGKDISSNFEQLIMGWFGENWEHELENYISFFKKLPLAVKTENKVFISHAGPPKNIKNLDDIRNIKNEGYLNNDKLYELIWNRYGDYNKKDIDNFLDVVGCNALVVGHTPVKGVKLIGKNQLILSSSYSLSKKAYLILDLKKEITNARDLLKMVHYLDG